MEVVTHAKSFCSTKDLRINSPREREASPNSRTAVHHNRIGRIVAQRAYAALTSVLIRANRVSARGSRLSRANPWAFARNNPATCIENEEYEWCRNQYGNHTVRKAFIVRVSSCYSIVEVGLGLRNSLARNGSGCLFASRCEFYELGREERNGLLRGLARIPRIERHRSGHHCT